MRTEEEIKKVYEHIASLYVVGDFYATSELQHTVLSLLGTLDWVMGATSPMDVFIGLLMAEPNPIEEAKAFKEKAPLN